MSYVKFLDRHEIVSASVNSTLTIWNTATSERARTLTGHVNARNFVGMEVNGPYIACGSETSQVCNSVSLVSTAIPCVLHVLV